ALWREVLGVELPLPFPRLSYADALDRYGTDKPDLRFGMPFHDLTGLLQQTEFRLFRETADQGTRIRGIVVPGGGALSRRDLDALAGIARAAGAAGALWVRRTDEGLAGQFAKALDPGLAERFIERTGLEPGDLFVVVVGHFRTAALVDESHLGASEDVYEIGGADAGLDALRRHLGSRLGLRDPDVHRWAWITEFPLFDWDVEEERLVAAHHPF